MKKVLLVVISLLAFLSLACGFSFSTANISEAIMAKDSEGETPTTVFEQDDVFYAIVLLSNAPDDTTVKASWVAVEAEGVDPNMTIDEVELTSDSGSFHFDLSNDKLWPVGTYKVDLYLNGELDRSLDFEVQGDVAAAEPDPSPTPEPEEEPTPTEEPAPAEEDDSIADEPAETESSTGDSLGDTLGSTDTDSDLGTADDSTTDDASETVDTESEPEAIPLQDDLYVHPSGAFAFGVPEGWEVYSEDEISAEFGDNRTRYGVIFLNPGFVYDGDRMAEFVSDTVPLVVDTFAENYEIISEDDLLDDSGFYYVAVSFNDENGLADFYYEQHDTAVYVFYFASLDYVDVKPTRDNILDTYEIDSDAAIAASPAEEEAEEKAPPTPAPAPANPFKPPAGVARVYLQNEYGSEYNIDFGDGSGSIQVPPGAQNFYHDVSPGNYRPGLSMPGGGAANIEFNIAADQAYLIVVTPDLGIRSGQVYP